MGSYNWATCSKVVKSQVNTLQTELQRLLGQQLSGIYLYGSLALGGFNPLRSDIDLLVVTTQRMDLATKRACIERLLRLSKMPCPIDIYFLVQKNIIPLPDPPPYDLHFNERYRERYQQDLRNSTWEDWNKKVQYDPNLIIDLTILQQHGICLYGQPIVEALPLVPAQDFQSAIFKDIQFGYRGQDLVSFVLNACRTSAYLYDHSILSKDEGGIWGLTHLPAQFQPLINQCLALYRSERLGQSAGRITLDNFITYMQSQINNLP